MIPFEQRKETKQGFVGESKIAMYLMARNNKVLPVYQIEKSRGKGPRLFLKDNNLIAPDMFVFNDKECCWIEAKHKTGFSWHRNTRTWNTGIDKRHFKHYCEVADVTPWPVWLMFLHKAGQAKDSPPSEGGLFGNKLSVLRNCIHHESNRYAYGMVYWDKNDLKKLASLEEVEQAVKWFRMKSRAA